MKKITLLIFTMLLSVFASAQCINTTPYLTVTSNNDGVSQEIGTCSYSTEYNTINGLAIGADYEFIATAAGVDAYVTITDTSNNVIAFGPSPLEVTEITSDSVRLHITADAACTGGNVCHVTSFQLLTPVGDICLNPSGLAAFNQTDVTAELIWANNGTNEIDYNVEVYLTGESAAGSNTPVFANANVAATSITATGLAELTTYDVYIVAACSGATANSGLVGPVTFTTTASCSDVVSISLGSATNVDVVVNWIAGTGNDSALVEVYAAGESAAGSNTPVYTNASATGGMVTATGLEAETAYDVYVTGQCGATSTAVQGPASFTTACDPIVAPYTEDFETFTTGTAAFTSGNCWTGSGGAYYWESAPGNDTGSGNTGPSPNITTGNYFYTEASAGVAGNITDLTAPLIDLTALTTPSVSFNYHMFGGQIGTLEVLVNGVSEFSLTGQQQASDTDAWGLAIVDLSAYSGTIQVVFRAVSAGTFEGDIAIDNVAFGELPACNIPAGTATIVPDCANTQFFIDVDVTDIGDGTSVINDGTNTYPATSLGIVQVGPYASGSSVTLVLENGGDPICDFALGSYSYACPPTNDECVDAIELTVNPDFACGEVTNGTVNGATASGTATACGGTEDDDVWFSFVATNATHRVSLINITGGTTDLYHAVYDADPGCGALAAALTCSDPNTSNTSGLTIGNTYFVQVYSWTATAGQTTVFDICIGTPPPPPTNDACEDAITINAGDSISGDTTGATNVEALTVCSGGTVGTTCDPGGDTTPNAGTLVFGTGVWYVYNSPGNESISIEDSANAFDSEIQVWSGACGALVCVAGDDDSSLAGNGAFVCFDSAATATTYYIYIDGNAATGVGAYTLNLNTTPLPPANDECANAEMLTFGVEVSADNTGATDSMVTADCFTGAIADLWYSFIAGAGGEVTITTTAAQYGVYSDCAGTQVGACNTSLVTGLTDGVTYYVRVSDDGTARAQAPGAFTLTVAEPTAGLDEFNADSLFSYYPNPVSNSLTLNAKKDISNVSVYNMVGQEVYRNAPNSVNNTVDMSNLQSGAYFVKVTVGNVTETIKVIKN